ncbi:unnamed protein product, partial [Ectocarpus sp. 12 AP-2014]
MIAGADPNQRDREGSSPLHLAAKAGHHGVAGILLLKGAQDSSAVDATDENGYTALHCCATAFEDNSVGDNSDAVRVLLEAGADVNATTTNGDCSTLLHLAVDRRMAPIGTIRALLEGGSTVNVRNELNETPLHTACKNSSVTGVELLLRCGADEELTDIGGEFP